MTEFDFGLLGRRIYGSAIPNTVAVIRRLFDFPTQARALESDWQIEILQSDAPIPKLESFFAAAVHSGSVEIATLPESTWVRLGACTVQLELREHAAKLYLHGVDEDLYSCLMVALIEAIRASRLLPMHTSIAAKNGIGTAFTGESGRGKTTTLIHSIKAGYQPVCEDFAWLEPESLMVFAADRGLRCLPDTLARVQQLFPQVQPVAFETDKYLVPFEQLSPRAWQTQLQKLWTLERDLSLPTRLEPLPAAQCVMALYGASGIPITAQTRAQSSQWMASLTKRLEIRRLHIGNTPLPF